ncbi:MAG TPA: hypothetical protein VLA09_04190, partial [Longimicrobiales bacterium]|nr:hypothetical protein [Longimicrobiales bacterium]
MHTKARTVLAVAAAAALGAGSARAQTSLFVGVGFGFGGDYGSTSLFVGTSFGLAHYGGYGNEYGIYSATYDGWGLGYRGVRHDHYSRASCWDYYWDSYWDPYGGWYLDCVAYGPYSYNSFRARSWRARWPYWPRSTFVYVRDPYWAPWGPYYAYDPWGPYWSGYWDGRRYGLFDDYYYGGRVRTVYASGGRRGVAVARTSPFARSWPNYKENPQAFTGRTATRRQGSAVPAAAPTLVQRPAPTRDRRAAAGATDAARGTAVDSSPTRVTTPRTATPDRQTTRSGTARAATPDRPTQVTTPRPAATDARPSDRLRGNDRGQRPVREGSSATSPSRERDNVRQPTGSRPSARIGTQRQSPSATDRNTPSTRSEPARAPSASRPSDARSGSAPRATPRSEPRVAPRSTPRLTPRSESRAAPRSQPQAAPRS